MIRQKIVNQEPWRISTAFTVTGVENGVQKGTFFDHVAILRENEDAVCPLNKCGVNITAVRQESEARDMYYEQAQETGKKEGELSFPREKNPDIEALKTEVAELKSLIVGLTQQKMPPEQKPEAKEKPAEVPKEPEASRVTATTTATPRKVIPAGETKSEDELKYDPRGMIILG